MSGRRKPIASDLSRVDATRDEELDYGDIPEVSAEDFARAVVHEGLPVRPTKEQVSLRIDSDVLEWFRKQGKGYQSRMNALLRAYMEAHRRG
ncbi:MAG: BrnA antitoxin family protein [Deltaproteobacteria bacterium]|nr:BrnA antitoxin family protein [Deltaproteobacteria bacterium]